MSSVTVIESPVRARRSVHPPGQRERMRLATLFKAAMQEIADPATLSAAAAESDPFAAADEDRLRILIVDQDSQSRENLIVALEGRGHRVHWAGDGRAGFLMALQVRPHILITEWDMAGMRGIGMIRALRETRFGRGIYVLITTEQESEEKLVAAFAAGADDFLAKPLNLRVMEARLRAAERVVRLQREVERDRDEIRRYADELAEANRRLREAALTDVLTGLPNRRYAIEFFGHEWQVASRSGRPLVAMLIDVDHFKEINDSHGHAGGDVVLKEIAAAIKRGLRAQDVVCRTGGDEFTVICPDTDLAAGLTCAERVRKSVAGLRFAFGGRCQRGSVSIGVAVRDASTGDIEALIQCADAGAYLAKQRGRNCVASVQAA
ncbi:GGDEF domain-containing response regulator [Sulfuricystis multivorans]|uniref:GGDEF domain-containing response regulator n=1 Tax=Sulfuricystis multivorans TaxID=2211108 RepID=UPI000F843C07|nr:diguanylate cyclase [Sulfuricystis multivorans]